MADKLTAESMEADAKVRRISRQFSHLDVPHLEHAKDAGDFQAPTTVAFQPEPGIEKRSFLQEWAHQFEEGFRWPSSKDTEIEQVRETYKNVLFSSVPDSSSSGILVKFLEHIWNMVT